MLTSPKEKKRFQSPTLEEIEGKYEDDNGETDDEILSDEIDHDAVALFKASVTINDSDIVYIHETSACRINEGKIGLRCRCYHKDKTCTELSTKTTPITISLSEAKTYTHRPCRVCWPVKNIKKDTNVEIEESGPPNKYFKEHMLTSEMKEKLKKFAENNPIPDKEFKAAYKKDFEVLNLDLVSSEIENLKKKGFFGDCSSKIFRLAYTYKKNAVEQNSKKIVQTKNLT